MLDANAFTAARIRKARDVTGSEDAFDVRLEIGVADDSATDRHARAFGRPGRRAHAGTHHDQPGIEPRAVVERDLTLIDRLRFAAQVELHAVLLVDAAHEISELCAEHAFEWTRFG